MTKANDRTTNKLKPSTASKTTKKDQLIKLLGTKSGADIKSLSDKLGWQQHTTRAAMSGLRKAGYQVAGEKPAKGGMSKFRILSGPALPQDIHPEATLNGA